MLLNCKVLNTDEEFVLKSPVLINKGQFFYYNEKCYEVIEINTFIFNLDGELESVELLVK